MRTVDVVIPCYNYARYLAQCVDSVLQQREVAVRALIIDDCSSDETLSVGAALAAADARVQFRRHEVNRGHIATYNEGLLEWAQADYVLLLSADDVLAPGALQRALDIMEAHPEVGMCFGPELAFEEQLPQLPTPVAGVAAFEIIDGRELIALSCDAADNPVGPTALLRTSLQRLVGGYRADMPHTADLAMWICCAAHGAVGRIHAVQAFKRAHPGNMIKQYATTILPDLLQRKLAFEVSLHDHAAAIADVEALRARARQVLARHAFWGAHELFERGTPEPIDRLLALAVELDPSWRDGPQWRRLAWKRRIGSRLWRLLQPLLRRLRGGAARPAGAEAPAP